MHGSNARPIFDPGEFTDRPLRPVNKTHAGGEIPAIMPKGSQCGAFLDGLHLREGGFVRRLVSFAIAVCLACCALPLASCKAPTLSDCDLQLFQNASGTGDTRDIVSGVVSLGGVYRQGDTAGRVICLNIGMSETSACDSISIESLTFHSGDDKVSRTYRIVPTERYLTWVKDPKGNTFDGARFEVTRTGE